MHVHYASLNLAHVPIEPSLQSQKAAVKTTTKSTTLPVHAKTNVVAASSVIAPSKKIGPYS